VGHGGLVSDIAGTTGFPVTHPWTSVTKAVLDILGDGRKFLIQFYFAFSLEVDKE